MTGTSQRRSGVLTLTTDFGSRDHYVGAMRGVVASVSPAIRVFDITHEIPHFEIVAGGYALAQAFPYYPPGTVHVVVIDPGVGSSRLPLAVAAAGHFFVAPDNGVLSQVLDSSGPFSARRVDERHGLKRLSQTFHGRDLFAPAGARLAAGLPFEEIGSPVPAPVRLAPADATSGEGLVLHVDSFGNVVTSFREADLPAGAGMAVGGEVVRARARSYADADAGRLFLIVGSSGYLEISLNQGSAATSLGVRAGAAVRRVD